jgi:hypothetical protein
MKTAIGRPITGILARPNGNQMGPSAAENMFDERQVMKGFFGKLKIAVVGFRRMEKLERARWNGIIGFCPALGNE